MLTCAYYCATFQYLQSNFKGTVSPKHLFGHHARFFYTDSCVIGYLYRSAFFYISKSALPKCVKKPYHSNIVNGTKNDCEKWLVEQTWLSVLVTGTKIGLQNRLKENYVFSFWLTLTMLTKDKFNHI